MCVPRGSRGCFDYSMSWAFESVLCRFLVMGPRLGSTVSETENGFTRLCANAKYRRKVAGGKGPQRIILFDMVNTLLMCIAGIYNFWWGAQNFVYCCHSFLWRATCLYCIHFLHAQVCKIIQM